MRLGDAADAGQINNGSAYFASSELATINHDDYQYDSTPHTIQRRALHPNNHTTSKKQHGGVAVHKMIN